MKVLIVNTSDLKGGAARAAFRLHTALLAKGVQSRMVVQSKITDNYTVLGPIGKLANILVAIRRSLDTLPTRFYKKREKSPFSIAWLSSSRVVRQINSINPDIVHLHWICGGMMSVKDISRIKAPIVWNLHDMWAFTGGCHYDAECGRYKHECGQCPILKSKKDKDISHRNILRKKKVYSKLKELKVITSSKWNEVCVKQSTLLGKYHYKTLPNCIPINVFKPLDKKMSKEFFGIPEDKNVVLFSSMDPLRDKRKGAAEVLKALEMVTFPDTVFVVAGSSEPEVKPVTGQEIYYIPPLSDDVSLAIMYNVADVHVVPSLQENLANSIAESISSGIPVVAFNIGGNPDMIEHKKTGYLAEPFRPESLAEGINWILMNKERINFTEHCRSAGIDMFESNRVAQSYIDIYQDILGKR